MSEPVRLFNAAGEWFDCAAPSEVVRLVASGEWRREAWPEPAKPQPQVQPVPDADEIPFVTPLPKRKPGRPRKDGGGIL